MIRKNEIESVSRARMSQWQFSRGEFLRTLALLGISTQLLACSIADDQKEGEEQQFSPLMSNQQAEIIQVVQNILFPNDGNGPSVDSINAFPYLLWYLQDELIEPYERKFFSLGADWANQEALKLFNQPFLDLSPDIQYRTVELLAKKKKTKLWVSKLITMIFEALLTDPCYGGNVDQVGWDWLNHNPGTPRSKEKYRYPTVLKTIRDEV
ncbi:MAG: gluconate 2-dehydrogenase subunit 3 family protein [Flavobacteriales bacterium]|jgi:hypothetical protein|nr:gluconate 2-dehydrogenase subunit 3 family protein [Flavobacteriales bacterium]